MRKSFDGSSRFQKFMNGNGFYVAIAACLLAVGGVAVALVGQGLFHGPADGVSEPPSSVAEPVEQVVTNQPDDRTNGSTTTTGKTTTGTTTTAGAPDLYILPLGNLVQKAYSHGMPAYCETMKDWRTHDGTDFAGEEGQKVRALARGTVQSIEEDPLWGEVLVIDHGVEVYSRYCGVHASVKVGDRVDVGDTVGSLVAIPCEAAQGYHLHLEMSVDGDPVDPVTALAKEVRYAEGAAPSLPGTVTTR